MTSVTVLWIIIERIFLCVASNLLDAFVKSQYVGSYTVAFCSPSRVNVPASGMAVGSFCGRVYMKFFMVSSAHASASSQS